MCEAGCQGEGRDELQLRFLLARGRHLCSRWGGHTVPKSNIRIR